METTDNPLASIEAKRRQTEWWKRVSLVHQTIKSSISIRLFTWGTLAAIVDWAFKFHKEAVELRLIPQTAVTILSVVYLFLLLLAARAFFLISETLGLLTEEIQSIGQRLKGHLDIHACVHSVIHNTRDGFFTENAFSELVACQRKEQTKHVFRTIENQLGMMEKAMGHLTGERCTIVLKTLRDGSFASMCYSPSVNVERKSRPTVIPADRGLVHSASITKEIEFTNDAESESRFWTNGAKSQKPRYKTVVACPIILDKQVRGMLCFDWEKADMYRKEYDQILACFTDLVSMSFYIGEQFRRVKPKTKTKSLETEYDTAATGTNV